MVSLRTLRPARLALASSLLIVTCCQTPQPTPPAPPAPRPVATPAPTPVPPQVALPPADNWIDRPQTPGDWRYVVEPGETLAAFGTSDAIRLVIGCNLATRKIAIVRAASAPLQDEVVMRIGTETASRALMAKPASGEPSRVLATLDARDPLLDAMAITRGRFAVEVEGEPGLYVPAWAEVTRVIEDCR
ncbi:hypothetical protein [Citromicrobium bathyomarinum]|uniref:hypothetical protein n=1 Tax=Citromicrobium bathyomarinum TaxID=72174 RepID=UPI00315A0930